jgi:hypothetical protein
VGCDKFGRPQSLNPGQGEGDRFSNINIWGD